MGRRISLAHITFIGVHTMQYAEHNAVIIDISTEQREEWSAWCLAEVGLRSLHNVVKTERDLLE